MKRSQVRLFMGLAALPAILLQEHPMGMALQAIYVIMLAISHGRSFRLLPNLILLLSVSSAHLLQPNGLQLATVGNFTITAGSLILGARKALTLIALLYLSHYMVTGRPRFPGRLGKLVSMQFLYLDRVTTSWRAIHPKRPFIGAIDRLLLIVEKPDDVTGTASESAEDPPATTRAIVVNAVHLMVLWALYLIGLTGFLPELL